MNTIKHYLSGVFLLALMSCVTVNIYFPEAAAEEALRGVARDILDKEPASKNGPDASLNRPVIALLEFLVPAAEAASQPDINVNTPLASTLKRNLKQGQNELEPYFESGAIGIARSGEVVPRDLSLVPLKERTKLKSLLSEDKKNRSALFGEIARANGHPEWEANIRDTFNRVFIEELPSGYWYQNASGQWQKK